MDTPKKSPLLDLVPELSSSSSMDMLSLQTPNRPHGLHTRGNSLTFFTPLNASLSPQLTRSLRSSTLLARSRAPKLGLVRPGNPFYNPQMLNLLLLPTRLTSTGLTPLQTPLQLLFSESLLPFKLHFDGERFLEKPFEKENTNSGPINVNGRHFIVPKSKSFHGYNNLSTMTENTSSDTLVGFTDSTDLDFLKELDLDALLMQHDSQDYLFQAPDFNLDIFLQAADMTLKMASALATALAQPQRITRSTASVNLASSLAPSDFEDSGSTTPASAGLFYEPHSGMVHLRSQPAGLQHVPYGLFFQNTPSMPNLRLTPQIHTPENGGVSAKAMAAAALLLPDGLDELKLILKKLKRSKKLSDSGDSTEATATAVENAPPGKKKKNHECPLCGLRFQRPEHVKRHMRSHSKEKPFHCDQPNCGKRFNRSDNLKAHLKKIHKLQL